MNVADAALGRTLKGVLWDQGISARRLASTLEMSPSAVSKKIHGVIGWSLADLYKAAALLGVSVADLLPKPLNAEATEFEPAQVPYRRARRDLNPQPSDP